MAKKSINKVGFLPDFGARVPLHHDDFPFVILWSEKAGCTAVAKWFFWQIGLLDEALDYHPWVHNYENDKFKSAPNYMQQCLGDIERGKPVVKFVRNPYNRSFSGYLELCNPKIAQPGPHWTKRYRRRVLTAVLGFEEELEYCFSFRQYINWLVAQPIAGLDPHLSPQYIKGEEHLITRIHQIETGAEGMRSLEEEFGLKKSAERRDLFQSEHHHRKKKLSPKPAVSVFDLGIPIRRTKYFQIIEPTLDEFQGDLVGKEIRRFFANDFISYGYELGR